MAIRDTNSRKTRDQLRNAAQQADVIEVVQTAEASITEVIEVTTAPVTDPKIIQECEQVEAQSQLETNPDDDAKSIEAGVTFIEQVIDSLKSNTVKEQTVNETPRSKMVRMLAAQKARLAEEARLAEIAKNRTFKQKVTDALGMTRVPGEYVPSLFMRVFLKKEDVVAWRRAYTTRQCDKIDDVVEDLIAKNARTPLPTIGTATRRGFLNGKVQTVNV